MNDLEKLIAYEKAIKELNEIRVDPDENDNFQHVDIILRPDTKIKEFKWNSDNVITETREFPFSVIQDVTSRIKKKIAYRKEKLSVKNLTEKNISENAKTH